MAHDFEGSPLTLIVNMFEYLYTSFLYFYFTKKTAQIMSLCKKSILPSGSGHIFVAVQLQGVILLLTKISLIRKFFSKL